ncbi:MAG: D-glycero-alpha-D-manno-heptose-1,7-bisphosphate 7-phosphatase [Gemmatimonadaceae bacterium]
MRERRRGAAFLDRDGTIIEDVDYISRPEDVRLIVGAARAIASLNAAGIPVVVVSNQSGIGRGYFGYDAYERVQGRVEDMLRETGAHLDATYICPHAPRNDAPCPCRKPGTELFITAARDHGVDLAASWYVGDRWRDIEPARTLGGTGRLVPTSSTPPEELERARREGLVRDSLADVAQEMIAALTGVGGSR